MKEVERGAGIITYTLLNGNKPLFLILKGGATIWGFPKGHIEDGEDSGIDSRMSNKFLKNLQILDSINNKFSESLNFCFKHIKKINGRDKDITKTLFLKLS